MPSRRTAVCTVALCGLRAELAPSEIEEALNEKSLDKLLQACLINDGIRISKPVKEKNDPDNRRHVVFLNCHSKDAANKACTALNQIKFESLGMDKYGYILQAVLKPGIKSVDWKSFSKADRKTVEGKISRIRNTHCFIDDPMRIRVPADAFGGGNDYAWKNVSEST
jgi:hypothetical protein